VLVHVVDGAGRDPEWEYATIRDELGAHDPLLLEKPVVVAFNKLDLPAAATAWPAFRRKRRREGHAVVAISARDGAGIDALRGALAGLLPAADELEAPPPPTGVVIHRLEAAGAAYTVEREGPDFRVRGPRIERAAAQTDFSVEESAERFQRDLVRLGIDGALRAAGVATGDTVRIGTVELEWEMEPWARSGDALGAGAVGEAGSRRARRRKAG
jgi:GTP-binding protein